MTQSKVDSMLRKMRDGAKKGGRARARNLTAAARRRIAKKAAVARWRKRPKTP